MDGDTSRRRPLRVLIEVWTLANISVWAFTLALGVHAYDKGGAAAVGLMAAARLMPGALVAPFAGRIVDRSDRARLVVLSTAAQAVCLAIIVVAIAADASLLLMGALAGLWSAGLRVLRPGIQALMPALATTPEELARATAQWAASASGAFLIAMAGGGAAMAVFSPAAAVAGAAVLVAASSLLALLLPSVPVMAPDTPAAPESPLAAALGGVRAIRDEPALHAPMAMFAVLLILEGTSEVQLVVLAIDTLGMGESGPGILNIGFGIGGVLASALLLVLLKRRGYGLALTVGGLVMAAGLLLVGQGGPALAVAALIPMGIGFGLVQFGAVALVPRLADDAVMGRVYALFEVLNAGAAGVGSLLAPLLITWFGAPTGLALTGGLFAVVTLLLASRLKRLDAGQHEADGIRDLLRGVPSTAPLPLPRLERLVRGVRPVSAAPGEVIMAKGDPGEDFFLIASGSVDVVEFGRTQGAGEGFGEIALLRDTPRTATVRAVDDVKLWALSRRTFLAAVTGSEEARSAADAVVDELLRNPPVAPQP